MIGTLLAVIAGLLGITGWLVQGWWGRAMILFAGFLATFSFFYYGKDRQNNAAMFLGCLVAWLSLAVWLFLAVYI